MLEDAEVRNKIFLLLKYRLYVHEIVLLHRNYKLQTLTMNTVQSSVAMALSLAVQVVNVAYTKILYIISLRFNYI